MKIAHAAEEVQRGPRVGGRSTRGSGYGMPGDAKERTATSAALVFMMGIASSVLFLLYRLLYQATDGTTSSRLSLFYLLVLIAIAVLQFTLMPAQPCLEDPNG